MTTACNGGGSRVERIFRRECANYGGLKSVESVSNHGVYEGICMNGHKVTVILR